MLADVGLLGFPNVGKSTFVAKVSAARPKIADYPFTTLSPSVGVVNISGGPRAGGAAFVIADIPGLIPGAAEGAGLGNRFLKHVERTRALLHLVTIDHGEGRDPVADYKAIRKELASWSPELAARPRDRGPVEGGPARRAGGVPRAQEAVLAPQGEAPPRERGDGRGHRSSQPRAVSAREVRLRMIDAIIESPRMPAITPSEARMGIA